MIAAKQQNKKEKENVLMLFFELKKILYSPGMKAMKPSVKSADVTSTFSTSNQQRCQPLQFCCIKKKRNHGCLEKLQGVCVGGGGAV